MVLRPPIWMPHILVSTYSIIRRMIVPTAACLGIAYSTFLHTRFTRRGGVLEAPAIEGGFFGFVRRIFFFFCLLDPIVWFDVRGMQYNGTSCCIHHHAAWYVHGFL